METPFPTSPLQFLGRFNPECNLLARVDSCQGDFQRLVLHGGLHIVGIYLMRQFENAEPLRRHFSLEHRYSLLLFQGFLLAGADDQSPRLG